MERGDSTAPPVGADAYQAVFWHAPDGILFTVPGGPVLAANPAACQLLGWSQDELRTRTGPELGDPGDERWQQLIAERDASGMAAGTVRLRRADNSSFEADVTTAIFADAVPGERRACILFRDTSDRSAALRRLSALHEMTRALLAGESTEAVLGLVAATARAMVGGRWGLVVGLADEPEKVVVLAGSGPEAAALEGRVFAAAGSPSGRVLADGVPARFDDVVGAIADRRTAALPVGPALVAPIVRHGHRYGTVVVANARGEPTFEGHDLDLVAEFAGYAAEAISVGEARAETERDLHAALAAEQATTHQLSARNARLEELDAARTQVLATVAHELRTPLTAIVSFTDLLGEQVGAEGTRYLAAVERNARRLLRLVGDVLLLSELSSPALHLEVTAFDVAALLDEAVRNVAAMAEERQLTVAAHAEPGPPLEGDYERLLQLLSNLLSNAVKYSPGGSTVRLDAHRRGGGWELTVADEGMGVPAGELGRLGERFFRASNARQQAVEGTGLGLSIVRAITDRHRGTLAVSSTEGRGTTVTVSLPDRP